MDNKALPPHVPEDIPVYHTVVKVLGAVSIMAVAGFIGLAAFGKPIPEALVALGSAGVGALAGLLAPSPQ